MGRKQKIALAVVVLGVGIAAAFQFRRTSSLAPTPAPTSGGLVHAGSPGAETARSATAFGDRLQSTLNGKPAAKLDRTVELQPRVDAAPGNPQIPGDHGTTPSSIPPLDATRLQYAHTNPLRGQEQLDAANKLIDLHAPEKTHRIVDGDTLPKLAEQYLGDPQRQLDLYQYNRDVLRTPDVLPIGAVLRIPSSLTLPERHENPSDAAAPALPLVPLSNQPAAETVPVSASANRSGPRTHKVQTGDNLVDLARKYYGDGRRYQDLFEANRRVLRTPADVKPGIVLVVP